MGSTSFFDTTFNYRTPQSAYAGLVEGAISEEGNSGYNGTISTTHGYQKGSDKIMTLTEAERFFESRLDSLSKWEAAEYVEVYKPSTLSTRKVVKKIRISGTQITDKAYPLRDIFEAARTEVTARAGETVGDVRIMRDGREEKISAKYRAVVETTEGKSETRYFAIRKGQLSSIKWENGFTRMADARAKLTKFLSEPQNGGNVSGEQEWEVVAMVGRPEGSAMISAKRELVWIEAEVEITFEKPTAKSETGYAFYGWAAM